MQWFTRTPSNSSPSRECIDVMAEVLRDLAGGGDVP